MMREFGLDVIMTSPQVTYKVRFLGDKAQAYERM
jgi:translation elongation factor EF-4